MNLGVRVALAGLLCACHGVDTVGVVVLDGAGMRAVPVLPAPAGMGSAAGDAEGAPANPAPGSALDAALPLGPAAAGAVADASVPRVGVDNGGSPLSSAAVGCGMVAGDPCSRVRVAAFTHALCACGSVIGAGSLDVHAAPGSSPAAVGVNGAFDVAIRTDGDLHTQLPPTRPGMSAPVSGIPRADDRGVLAPPCACGPGMRLDIASLVSDAAQHNDNSVQALSPDVLNGVPAATPLEFGCGRFYLLGANVRGDLRLRVRGHAVVVVDGDLIVAGDVQVELLDAAEIDLIVGGSLMIGGAARFAMPEQAARARIYVAAQLALSAAPDREALQRPPAASGDTILVGNFYAPNAVLQLAAASDVYGSLFVAELLLLRSLSIHSALPGAGGSCGF